MSFETGQVLASRYRLEERIATGGMGEVWRAVDQTLMRAVAVKVLRPDTADDRDFAERFRAEARHMGVLTHPNIGTVHDFGDDAGTAYLVMELMEGEPLSTIIRDQAPMDPVLVSDILVQAASALQAAHDAGVVHRDVKPANIVVDPQGYAKLTDFGIARAMSEASLTQTGEVLGTPHYLSPEQALGQQAGPLSDVYALAVVGYEMLTGERPFAGDSMVTTALAHVSQPAPPLPDTVPEPLRTVVMAALAKDPAQRPTSAVAFADALRGTPDELGLELRQGAASAVAPVIVGVPVSLPPDVALPTTVLETHGATVLTPTGLVSVGSAAPPMLARPRPARRPGPALLAVVGAIVVIGVIVAVALASRSGSAAPAGPATPLHTASAPPATATAAGATTSTTTAATAVAPQPASGAGNPGHAHGKGKGGHNK